MSIDDTGKSNIPATKKGKIFLKNLPIYLGVFLIILAISAFFLFKAKNSKGLTITGEPKSPFLSSPISHFESPEFLFVEKTSLAAAVSPITIKPQVLGSLIGEDVIGAKREIIEYTVEDGDTIKSLALKFNISENTILYANDLRKGVSLKQGDKLVILPVSGVIHLVEKGETLSDIAKIYKADEDRIIAFNNLNEQGNIYRGDLVVVPDGVMPSIPIPVTPINIVDTYFIAPTTGTITQGVHLYNAVDVANKCGTPIFAAAGGRVIQVGYDSWPAGNFVKIEHYNEVITMYGHLSSISVEPNQTISQGEKIGTMGTTGKSTGCHLHFDVLNRGVKNPLSKYLIGTFLNWE